jgi:hypothetical protein
VALMDDNTSGRVQGPTRGSDVPAKSLDQALNRQSSSAGSQHRSGAGARAPGLARHDNTTLPARFFPHDGAVTAPIQRFRLRCDNAACPGIRSSSRVWMRVDHTVKGRGGSQ